MLLPCYCHICHRPIRKGAICFRCIPLARDRAVSENGCFICHAPLMYSDEADYCHTCSHFSLPLSRLNWLYSYDDKIRSLIITMKYRPSITLIRYMAEEVATTLKDFYPLPNFDGVVAVPSSKKGIKRRGFSTAEVIAEAISFQLGIGYFKDILVDSGTKPPQIELTPKKRFSNVAGKIQLVGGIFKGLNFLLVDDVYTTGASLNHCARLLNDAGARSVSGLVYALAPKALMYRSLLSEAWTMDKTKEKDKKKGETSLEPPPLY